MSLAISLLSLIFSIAAIVVAYYIPKRIMVNQIYADLLAEYRTVEMGAAIFSIFKFYVKDCGNDVANIHQKYREKYDKQIEEPLNNEKPVNYSDTLHFQRRLVSHYFYHMARLWLDNGSSNYTWKLIEKWIGKREIQLLALVLHMAKPAAEVFEKAENLTEAPSDYAEMNIVIQKLYKELLQRNGNIE